jgi:hypothetical protein
MLYNSELLLLETGWRHLASVTWYDLTKRQCCCDVSGPLLRHTRSLCLWSAACLHLFLRPCLGGFCWLN